VVAPAVARRRRRLLGVGAAVLAVAFLVVMAVSGRVRESGQFVRFVAAGVLTESPAEVDRIELTARDRRWVFRREAGGWRVEAGARAASRALSTHLDDSIKFMHVSAPVRVMERREWPEQGLREFGLDPPRYRAALFQGPRRLLAADFGSPTPQQVLQYMHLEGREQVYVMSRFIGQEWEQALAEAGR
jgi:hypothetical protein